MIQQKNIVLTAGAIIIVVLFGVIYLKKLAVTGAKVVNTPASNKVLVLNKTTHDASASIGYEIKTTYPQIKGIKNPDYQTKINEDLKKIVNAQVTQFKNEVNSADKNIPITGQATLNVSYKTSQADNKFVSIWFTVSDFQLGAAHPNNYNLTYTFDLKNGKEIKIADLFKDDSDWVQTLSSESVKAIVADPELKGMLGISDFAKQGASPNEENFKLFNLTRDNLILIFNPGTVAAEFAGTRKVEIPFKQLQGLLVTSY